jgi:amidase
MTATPAKPTISMALGMPFSISFIGTAFSKFKLISYVFAYEQATHNHLKWFAFKDAILMMQLKDVISK